MNHSLWNSLPFQIVMAGFSALGLLSALKLVARAVGRLSTRPNSPSAASVAFAKKNDLISPMSVPKLSKLEDDYQEYKMVLLIRQDLEMTKGKVASQCCHATLAAYKALQVSQPSILARWEASGQPKITLKVKDEKEMLELMTKAQEAGLCAKAIKDAGRTQISPGSRTVLAIGPGPISLIDYITGHLKLY